MIILRQTASRLIMDLYEWEAQQQTNKSFLKINHHQCLAKSEFKVSLQLIIQPTTDK